MTAPTTHAPSNVFLALGGAALITALAWQIGPDPADAARAATADFARSHHLAQPAAPAALPALPAPAPAAPQAAAPSPKAPAGRSFKCLLAGQVEYTDRPCPNEADATLVNTSPAMRGAGR